MHTNNAIIPSAKIRRSNGVRCARNKVDATTVAMNVKTIFGECLAENSVLCAEKRRRSKKKIKNISIEFSGRKIASNVISKCKGTHIRRKLRKENRDDRLITASNLMEKNIIIVTNHHPNTSPQYTSPELKWILSIFTVEIWRKIEILNLIPIVKSVTSTSGLRMREIF